MTDATQLTGPILKRHTISWIVYDLANTIYAATITYLLIDYVKDFRWGSTAAGIVQTAAMICAGLATPIFASLADRTGKAHAYCTITTIGCIAAMAGFGAFMEARFLLMACFFCSTVCYQAALVFYNSLLPSVADEKKMGLVSGLGVGFGYLGNVFTLAIAVPIQIHWGLRPAFFVTAAGFLVCALPNMFLVRDRRAIRREPFTWRLVGAQFCEIIGTVRDLPKRRPLMWFLIGNFCAVDVLNTAILFFAAFVTRSFAGMAESGELVLLGATIANINTFKIITGLAVTMAAFAFAIALGYLADRVGSTRAFTVAIAFLALGLAGAALFAGEHPFLFIVVMCGCGGVGLAGIWTAGRKILIELVPREQVGRYFGLYGITNKVSVIGSTVFGLMMDVFGPRIAILSQVLPLLMTFFCVYKMTAAQRSAGGPLVTPDPPHAS